MSQIGQALLAPKHTGTNLRMQVIYHLCSFQVLRWAAFSFFLTTLHSSLNLTFNKFYSSSFSSFIFSTLNSLPTPAHRLAFFFNRCGALSVLGRRSTQPWACPPGFKSWSRRAPPLVFYTSGSVGCVWGFWWFPPFELHVYPSMWSEAEALIEYGVVPE
jgi:hypothetical protein